LALKHRPWPPLKKVVVQEAGGVVAAAVLPPPQKTARLFVVITADYIRASSLIGCVKSCVTIIIYSNMHNWPKCYCSAARPALCRTGPACLMLPAPAWTTMPMPPDPTA
jgi:hypothetical protein